MIYNPMTTRNVQQNFESYPPKLQAVFRAVDSYAYEACAPIEGPLGEGRIGGLKQPFNYFKLLRATIDSIKQQVNLPDSFHGAQLRKAMEEADISDADKNRIILAITREAVIRINEATSDDLQTYSEHGHHGRQHIASRAVEGVMRKVLPLSL